MEEFFSDLEAFLVLQFYTGNYYCFYCSIWEKMPSLELLNWFIRKSFSSLYSLGCLWNQDSKSTVKKPTRIPFPAARLFQKLKLAYLKAIKSPLKHYMWFYRAQTYLIFFPYFGISAGIGQKVLIVIRKSVHFIINPTHNIKLFINFCNIKLTFWETKLAAL